MAIPPSLLVSARSAYRSFLRASRTTFAGDAVVKDAFRAKIRNEILTCPPHSDENAFQEKINLTREIADVLRTNIAQAVKVEDATDPASGDRFKLRITEHTELGSNDTVKDPEPIESSRSARKRTSSADAAQNDTPQIPRFYSQLKKAHKQRVIPELKEEDLEESFVRGSGPGGQSINKTENNVQLLHKPTGMRVACQETRSLNQNRALARKWLLDKLDALYNPGLSRQEMRKARQLERERRRKKKAKHRAKKSKETEEPEEEQSDREPTFISWNPSRR